MGWNDGFSYPPLKTNTQTRLVIVAPGQDDEPIHCVLLVIDLDDDWRLKKTAPESCPSPGVLPMETKTPNGEFIQTFAVPAVHFHAEKDRGLYPFQRYTALSYVWGDQSRSYEIFVDGSPFKVGYNLWMALKQLRHEMDTLTLDASQFSSALKYFEARHKIVAQANHLPSQGRVLWIDAICINQADIDEREAQVQLMSRIYQQADHVHAELGVPEVGTGWELLQLLQAIIRAGTACDSSQLLPAEPNVAKPSLEDHGIPEEEHALWDQWRLFLNSPYFRRLWIVQEFCLAKSITLRFGAVSVEPTLVSTCIGYLEQYSTNGGFYCFPKDNPNNEAPIYVFNNLATQRRLITGFKYKVKFNGSERSSLLGKLSLVRDTAATDSRDKIYGLLSLASDGSSFHHLISYSKSVEDVYVEFARDFIGKGQGLEMLYQVDSRVSKTLRIPTWVPDWSRSRDEASIWRIIPISSHTEGDGGSWGIQCLNSKLLISALLADTVSYIGSRLRDSSMRLSHSDIFNFLLDPGIPGTKKGKSAEGDQAVEIVFHTLLCTNHITRPAAEIDRLRHGIWSIFSHMAFIAAGGSLEHSPWQAKMREFCQVGFPAALGRRWCVTKNGHLGLAPAGAKIGDRVAFFHDGLLPFIVRPLSEAKDTEYALVGHAYIHDMKREKYSNSGTSNYHDIVLV